MQRIALIVCGLVAAFALGLSCYTVPEPDCGFVCGAGSACPEDYLCGSGSICRRIGAPPSTVCMPDAGPIDAPFLSPMAVSTVPIDGATGVSRSAPITAMFDQPIDATSVSTTTFVVTTAGGVQVPGTVSLDAAMTTATFQPTSELPAGAMVTVQLTANIASVMGSAPLEPLTFTFTTIDDEAPTLVSSVPLAQAIGVPDASTIAITFSEPVMGVDTTSFAVSAVTPIAGTIAAGSGSTYTFAPTAALPAATVITVTLSGAISDLAGNSLLPVSFSFTTQ